MTKFDGHTDERGGNMPTPDNAPKATSNDGLGQDFMTAEARKMADGSASGFGSGAPGYVPPMTWDTKTGRAIPQSERAGAGPKTHGQ